MHLPAATFYRQRKPNGEAPVGEKWKSRCALSDEERRRALCVLQEDRFVDKGPAEVYAALLDEGFYHCFISTMYRILCENGEVRAVPPAAQEA